MKWSNLDEQGMRPVSRPGRLRAFFAVLGLSSGLAACGDGATSVESPPSTETAIAPTTVIDEVILRQRIKTLSSDEFAGRAPVTEGGAKTRAFLIEEMKAIGLVPGNGDSYEQQVPLVEVTVDPAQSSLTINGEDLTYGPQTVYWTKRVEESVSIQDTEMVFVGYGIVAPEYGWDDYAGLDVTNKTVVMLVNDPGFATQDDAVFNGNAMTYYGRWTYKYEEAARQGAAAALVIHQTKPAAYGWGVVEGSWSGPQLDLERPDGGASRVAVEGWLHEDQARALFSSASLDFDGVTSSASAPGFKPVSIPGQTLSASLTNTIKKSESANVAGILTGTTYPDEYVLYMGHWDHLGAGEGTGDTIFNGAVDNATGTAGILSVVEAFAKNETRPERSILVVGVTAEESGLLGSAYLAEDPIVPLSQIVAGINIDAMLPTPPSKDLIVVGFGASEVENILEDVAAARGKYLRPDPEPEKGYFYRSDHISLAKKGVPMLYADAGIDFVEGGTDAGSAFVADYAANRYHKPADEYTDDWEMGTLIDTLSIFYEVGAALAYSDSWPNWNEGNEFRAIRDAQRPDEDTGD
ncbi:MAG: M28 family metallopeptidase [Pseudomonadota bacterium]